MAIQGLNFSIQNSGEAHQSYQATGSFVVYNPNDGVAYVATDRTANGLSWDYKVPSQSGGKFPGPINSYLSIFYLDQTGTGAGGQVVVYASTEAVNIPYFWSIGRALQGQQTSMDIVQGAQPGNPGAGITRLWSDPSGSLNILMPNGTNKVVLDSSNAASYVNPLIGQYALGADLYGTPSAGHVGIQNNSYVMEYDTHGTLHRVLGAASSDHNYLFTGTSGVLIFYSDYPGAQLASWSAVTNTFTTQSAWITTAWMATGTYYINTSPTSSSRYIQDANPSIRYAAASGGVHSFESSAGGYASLNCGAIGVNGNITTTGVLVLPDTSYAIQFGGSTNTSIYGSNANSLMQFTAAGTAAVWRWYAPGQGMYCDFGLSLLSNNAWAFAFHNSAWIAVGQGFVVGGNNLNGQSFFCAGGSGGPTGWQIISDEKLKSAIVPIADPLSYLLDPTLSGYYYHVIPPKDIAPNEYDSFGFMGQAWKSRAPHMINEDGDHLMMEPTQVTPVLWEALKEYIQKTDLRLAALESGRTTSPG